MPFEKSVKRPMNRTNGKTELGLGNYIPRKICSSECKKSY